MKGLLSTALILSLCSASAVSAAVITLPLQSKRTLSNLNAESLTRRLLSKRAVNQTVAPLTAVENDVCYTVPFQLGTPAQQFNVLIDTGSPITWISSSTCLSSNCVNGHQFDCSKSSTCTVSSSTFNISYVSGQAVSGTYVADTYTIGSLAFTGIAGVVTQNSASLPPSADGIMGLWYVPSAAQSTQPYKVPILNMLASTNGLTENVIGVYLQQNNKPTSETSSGGEISFGGLNSQRYTGSITYVNNVAGQQWTIPVAGLKVGTTSISTAGATAAIDTGTTAMLVPKSVADALNGAIPGAVQDATQGGNWLLPCSGNTPISITFGTFTITIPYTSLAIQAARVNTAQGVLCQSAAMFPAGSTASIPQWLIGDAVLSNVYTVFDFGTNAASGGRIGFANLGSGGSTTSGGTSGGTSGSGSTSSSTTSDASFKGIASSAIMLQASALVAASALFALL